MTLTADQVSRLEASLIDYRYRVLVAGPRGSVAEQDIAEGQPYTAYPETTIASLLSPDDTELQVASTTGFPDSGGLYIWPYGATEVGQFLKYNGRTSTVFQNVSALRTTGVPNADYFYTGATVSVWREVTDKVTGFNFNETLEDVEGKWTLQLNGIDYDSVLLAQNNMVIVLVSYSPEPSDLTNWSDYTVLCTGYITPASVQDDYRRGANWTLNATGLNLYTSKTDMQSRRYGRADLVEGSSTSASTFLPDSAAIGYTGEVIGRQTMESDKAVDGSMSTAYASVVVPAVTEINGTLAGPQARLTEIGFGPVGTGPEGAYMVVWSGNDIPMRHFNIGSTRYGTWPPNPAIWTKDNEKLPTYPAGSRLILCRNREVFESWAGSQDIEVFEWRTLASAKNFYLRPEGDAIWFNNFWEALQNIQIRWGDVSGATLPALNYGESYYIPGIGEDTIDGTWALTDTNVPGRNSRASAWAYLSVEVPPLAITLGSAMTPSNPANGGTITVAPSTAGLNQNGGEVIIDTERIAYTSATVDTITGITRANGGTTAANHEVGANIYPFEGGLAIQNEFVDYFGWKRKRVYENGNPVVPENFEIWYSQLASPTYPGTDTEDDTWKADWIRWVAVTGNTQFEWNTPISNGNRKRHIMILCNRMANDGRFVMSEIEAKRRIDYDPTATAVSTVGEIFQIMLVDDFGLNYNQVDTSDISPVAHDFVATRGRLSDRLRELAAQTGSLVLYNRDNTITIKRSPWHPLYGLIDVTETLTRDNLRSVSLVESQRNAISQVVLNVRNPETKETFQVQFPPSAMPLGEQLEIERTFQGSANEARYLAEMIYRQSNNQDRVDVVLKGHGDGFRIGQRVLLTWDMDRSGTKFQGKNFIVTGISLSISATPNAEKRCEWGLTLQEYLY